MNLYNKILFCLTKHKLVKNLRYKNIHKGESCYIFGNGISLKSMNLKNFNDKIAIGSNSLFIHNDFRSLNCKYYLQPPALIFTPINIKYYNKYQRNYVGDLYRKKMKIFDDTHYFTSIYNSLNIRADNITYMHHFGIKDYNLNECELDRIFSFSSDATVAMIGTAIYMGFSEAILVGMDYTFSPPVSHHFYERGRGVLSTQNYYKQDFFEQIKNKIDLLTITLEGKKSDTLPYKSYSEYTGENERYRKNIHCVDKESLDMLDKTGFYNIYNMLIDC